MENQEGVFNLIGDTANKVVIFAATLSSEQRNILMTSLMIGAVIGSLHCLVDKLRQPKPEQFFNLENIHSSDLDVAGRAGIDGMFRYHSDMNMRYHRNTRVAGWCEKAIRYSSMFSLLRAHYDVLEIFGMAAVGYTFSRGLLSYLISLRQKEELYTISKVRKAVSARYR